MTNTRTDAEQVWSDTERAWITLQQAEEAYFIALRRRMRRND